MAGTSTMSQALAAMATQPSRSPQTMPAHPGGNAEGRACADRGDQGGSPTRTALKLASATKASSESGSCDVMRTIRSRTVRRKRFDREPAASPPAAAPEPRKQQPEAPALWPVLPIVARIDAGADSALLLAGSTLLRASSRMSGHAESSASRSGTCRLEGGSDPLPAPDVSARTSHGSRSRLPMAPRRPRPSPTATTSAGGAGPTPTPSGSPRSTQAATISVSSRILRGCSRRSRP